MTPDDPDEDDEHTMAITAWSRCEGSCTSYTSMPLGDAPFSVDESSFTLFVPISVDAATTIQNGMRYKLTLRVHDSLGLAAEQEVNVHVTFLNHAPTVATTATTLTVPENSASQTPLGKFVAFDEDQGQTLMANITSGSPSVGRRMFLLDDGTQMTANSARNTGGNFAFEAAISVGDLENANRSLDFESVAFFELTIDVWDDYSSAPLHVVGRVLVSVLDVNEPPRIVIGQQSGASGYVELEIVENSAAGTVVGAPIRAVDPDTGATLQWSMVSDEFFTIDSHSGQITASGNAGLDYETLAMHELSVQVTDNGGLSDQVQVLVHVADENEAPAIDRVEDAAQTESLDNVFIVPEDAARGLSVARVLVSDTDFSSLWGLTSVAFAINSRPVDGIFSVSRAGEITVENAAALDYENLASAAASVQWSISEFVPTDASSFEVGTRGCGGFLECQFSSLTDAQNFCAVEAECTHILHQRSHASHKDGRQGGCSRGLGCFFPRSADNQDVIGSAKTETTTAVLTDSGRSASTAVLNDLWYSKAIVSDPTAVLTLSVVATDGGGLSVSTNLSVRVSDANDVIVLYASKLSPEQGGQISEILEESTEIFSTAGGEPFYLYGFNLGPNSPTSNVPVRAWYGHAGDSDHYEATSCTLLVSMDKTYDNVIQCITAPGVGFDLQLTVAVGAHVVESAATLSYAAPVVLSAPIVETQYSDGVAGRCTTEISTGVFVNAPYSERFQGVGDDASCRRLCDLCIKRDACAACQAYDWNVKSLVCRLYATGKTTANGRARRRCYNKLDGTTQSTAFRTVGGDPFVLEGENFGPIGTKVSVFYGADNTHAFFVAEECRIVVGHTRIMCVSAPGVGVNLGVTVSIAGQTARPPTDSGGGGGSSAFLAYAPPVVEDIAMAPDDGSSELIAEEYTSTGAAVMAAASADDAQPLLVSALPTSGGTLVDITGVNFPPLNAQSVNTQTTLRVTYGSSGYEFNAVNCRVVQTGTVVRCLTSPGWGVDHVWIVTVAGVASAPSSLSDGVTTSYAPPQIDSCAGPGCRSASTSGYQAIMLFGSNLYGPLVDVRYGSGEGQNAFEYSGLLCFVLMEHEAIGCLTSPGTGGAGSTNYNGGFAYRVRIGEQTSASVVIDQTGYAPPSLSAIEGDGSSDASTLGGQRVRLTGTNLPPYDLSRTVVSYSNGEQTFVADGCTLRHQWSDESNLLSQFLDVNGNEADEGTPNTTAVVTSRRMATPPSTMEDAVSGLVYAPEASFLDCRTVASTGARLQWEVVVNGQASAPPTSATRPPRVTGVSGYDVNASRTEGRTVFQIHGQEFGPVGLGSPSIRVTYGPTGREYEADGCEVTSVVFPSGAELSTLDDMNHNATITCASVAGVGSHHAVLVRGSGQESDLFASRTRGAGALFSYSAPEIIAVSHSVINTGSNREIQIFGRNFGPPPAQANHGFHRQALEVNFGGGNVSSVRHISHVEVRFVVPDWQVGTDKPIVVMVGGQVSNAVPVSFAPPMVLDVGQSEEYRSIYDGTTIFVHGTSFGASAATGRVLIDGAPCVVNSWTHTRIECETLDLSGTLEVITGPQRSTPLNDFSVEKFLVKPQVESLSIDHGDPQGGYLLTIEGTNLADSSVGYITFGSGGIDSGNDGNNAPVCAVDPDQFPGTYHTDERVVCVVPPGSGRVNVTAHVEWQSSTVVQVFEYAVPRIESLTASDHGTLGGALVTLEGEFLGDPYLNLLWDGVTSVVTQGSAIGANGSRVSVNSSHAFCATGCEDFAVWETPCTHPSCMACQWYLRGHCEEDIEGPDGVVEAASASLLCSDECIASGYALDSAGGQPACSIPLLRVVAQCPVLLDDNTTRYKSDIVVVNRSDSSLTFLSPPGQGTGHTVSLMSREGDVTSNEVFFDYDRPVVGAISTQTSGTAGAGMLTITGRNFGEMPSVVFVFRREVSLVNRGRRLSSRSFSPNRTWVVTSTVDCSLIPSNESSHESVSCSIPEGQGRGHLVYVQAGDVRDINGTIFDYDGPELYSIEPDAGDTKGGWTFTLTGLNLGLRDAMVTVGNATADVISQNHTHIVALAPGGKGMENPVWVSIGGQESSSTVLNLRYLPPSISVVFPNPANAHDGEMLLIEGHNFGGDKDANVSVEINGEPCVDARWVNIDERTGSFSSGDSASSGGGSRRLLRRRLLAGEDVSMNDDQTGGCNGNFTDPTTGETHLVRTSCHPVIQCRSPQRQRIGGVSVRVAIADQQAFVPGNSTPLLTMGCPFNMYGREGSKCMECPPGALCPGGLKDPISLAGWWKVDTADEDSYDEGGDDAVFVKCLPASACLGNNTCAPGYEPGVKYCARCAAPYPADPDRNISASLGYYRVDLACLKCDAAADYYFSTAVLSIVLFVCLIWVLAVFEFKLASLNILVDFLQVMALCASINLNWGAAGDMAASPLLIRSAALFNFNFETFMPACVFPQWSYEGLWWFMMATPPGVLIIIQLGSLLHLGCGRSGRKVVVRNDTRHQHGRRDPDRHKRREQQKSKVSPDGGSASSVSMTAKQKADADLKSASASRRKRIRNRKKEPHPHAKLRRMSSTSINPHAWGAYGILMYYVFFPLCLRSWEPFDCTGYAVGNNGTFYTMDADPTEQCYGAEDSTYWVRMSPFAALLGLFYSVGVPTLLGLTFARYHDAIEKDQIRQMEHETEGQSWRRDLAAKRLQSNMRGMLARRNYGTHSFYARHKAIHDTTLVRKHYGKLYEDFRPHLYWWRVVQMARKVLLALCIFLPGSAPVFQATVAILVLFISFVAQVKYRPYLARPSHPVTVHASGASRKAGGNITGLFGSGGGRAAKAKQNGNKISIGVMSTNANDDDDLARKRWKKAIMVTRTEVRWHHRVGKHAKDSLAWLFDYNSLEMMALTCAIIILLNGIMLETNSLRAPVLGVLKIASSDVTMGFVRFVDTANLALFIIPCVLLPLSIVVDIWRNIAFAIHNRQMKARRREVAVMAARAEAVSRDARLSNVNKWRVVQQKKLDEQLAQLDADHRAIMMAMKEEYDDDREEKAEDLRTVMKNRATVQAFMKALRQSTPEDAVDAQKLAADLRKTTAARDQCDKALLDLEEEMNELDVNYRKKSADRQHKYVVRRQQLIDAFQEALRRQMEAAESGSSGGSRKGEHSGNMPVQLQMKVLVSQRKFDDTQRHITVVKTQMEMMQKDLSREAMEHLKDLEELEQQHAEQDADLEDQHAERAEEKAAKISELERQQQALLEQQREGNENLHQIDMAAQAHQRALKKELTPEQYKAYLHAVEMSRVRREKLAEEEEALKSEGLSADELEARLRELRQKADDDVAAYMCVVDSAAREKHAALVRRLAAIAEKRARAMADINMARANGEGISDADLEARIRAAQEAARVESEKALAEAGKKGSAVHDRLLMRLNKKAAKRVKNEAMARAAAKAEGASPEAVVKAVDAVASVDKLEEAEVVDQLMVDEEQEKNTVLQTVTALKEEQGVEIFALLQGQQSGDGEALTGEELSEAVARIKRQSDERIETLLQVSFLLLGVSRAVCCL